MKSYFPFIMGHFKFIDDNTGKTFPPSTIVKKYKKKYDSMTPQAFEEWLYTEHNLRVFFC